MGSPGIAKEIIKAGSFPAMAPAAITKGSYVVYQAVDNAGRVRYIGITSITLAIRSADHLTKAEFQGLRFITVSSGLSKQAARILEQNLINQQGLPNLINKINSIAPKYWQYFGL